jgi:hypothetical protein
VGGKADLDIVNIISKRIEMLGSDDEKNVAMET